MFSYRYIMQVIDFCDYISPQIVSLYITLYTNRDHFEAFQVKSLAKKKYFC